MTGTGGQSPRNDEDRIEDLFDRARSLSDSERSALLDASCRDEPELRQLIERMLAAHNREHALLDAPLMLQLMRLSDEFEPKSWIGQQIDRYVLTRHIATGGMGIVFEAALIDSDKRVAVKFMQPGLLSRRTVERFVAEAEVLFTLRHPGIARIESLGLFSNGAQNIPYYAMELVPNATAITSYAARYSLPLPDRLSLFLRVCDAVQHGHEHGIVHRDLKPANILIDETITPDALPQPKVIDFGIAHTADSDLAITAVQTLGDRHAGTLQYMAPEQFDTTPIRINQQSDVYSLGLILYELTCKKLPYDLSQCSFAAAAATIRSDTPLCPRNYCSDMDDRLETILLTALSKEQEGRYASVADLTGDIRLFLDGQAIVARGPGPILRARKWISQHSWLSSAAAAILVLLVVITIGSMSLQTMRNAPHAIRVIPELNEVRLVTVAGHVMHTWQGDERNRIRAAVMIRPRHPRQSSRALIVIGYDRGRGETESLQLDVYSAQNHQQLPLWSSGVRDDELPPELVDRGFAGASFHVSELHVLDMFPEVGSPQLLAVYRNSIFSHCLVRVYDQNGNALFQFWHDGAINDIHWMPDAKLLVVAALNSEVYWEHRGEPDVEATHPLVVFAIRPTIGALHSGWVTPTSTPNRVEPAWYRCITPPELAITCVLQLRRPPGNFDFGRTVEARLVHGQMAPRYPAIHFVIDQHGRKVPGTLVVNDHWRRNPETPPPDSVSLGELPPILEHYRETSGPGRVTPLLINGPRVE